MPQRISDTKIRHMKCSDIKPVAKIDSQCFSTPWSENAYEEELQLKSAIIFVAELNSEIIGFISTRLVLDEVYINNIAVAADYRKSGVGALLLTDLEDYIKNMAAFITLEVRESNLPARALYTSCGYKPVGIRKNFYEKPVENAILMTKSFDNKNV